MGAFTSQLVIKLGEDVDKLQERAASASPGGKEALTQVGIVTS